MKKILLLIFSFFLMPNTLYALTENSEFPRLKYEQPILLEPNERFKEEISPYSKEALRGIIEKDYDLTSPEGMFSKQLSATFRKGIIENANFHVHLMNTFDLTMDSDENHFGFEPSKINIGVQGKFRNKKENYALLLDLTPSIFDDFSHRFLLDAYIETRRIPNHTILFGSSRPQLGFEGGNSSKTIPFLTRSQAARNFSNARKLGIKADGRYKWVDYEIGGFSSDYRYHEFFPGVEGNIWIDFKPLANVEEKYGKLYVGGGVSHGTRNSTDFTVASSALRYDYKKFWMRAEFQQANGSNGRSGLTSKEGYGYNLTLAYRITKKIEFLLRFDEFDVDKSVKNNNTREYTAGINWYILGQCARVMLNYIFCENEAKHNSHRLMLGTQFIL